MFLFSIQDLMHTIFFVMYKPSDNDPVCLCVQSNSGVFESSEGAECLIWETLTI